MVDVVRGEAGFAPVEGGRLYYEVVGEGYPLALIHAGVADHRMWDEQVAAFAPYYRVIRYDTRGFGRSETDAGTFSDYADLLALMDHLGVAQAHVVGLSRGGGIAIDFCLEHPDRVRALIPVASGVDGLEGWEALITPAERAAEAAMEAATEAGDLAALADLEVRYWADGPGQPEGRAGSSVRERLREMIRFTQQNQPVEPTREHLSPPALTRLGEISAPTLVMYGDLDESVVMEGCEQLARGIAGARKIVFPGVAHMVNMERPTEFNRVALEFLGGLGLTGR